MAVHNGTVRSLTALIAGCAGPALGSLSDVVGRRPLLGLWNLSWLLRPIALMSTTTLTGRLVADVSCAALAAGGGSANAASFADLFGSR